MSPGGGQSGHAARVLAGPISGLAGGRHVEPPTNRTMPTQMTSSSDLGVVGDTVRPAVGMRVVSAALLHACVRSTLDAACSGPHL